MLGRVEGGSAEQIEVAGSYCEACQRRVSFRISVDEVVVAEGEKISDSWKQIYIWMCWSLFIYIIDILKALQIATN